VSLMFSLRADIGTWAAFVELRAVFRALDWRRSVFEYTEGHRWRSCMFNLRADMGRGRCSWR